MSREDERPVAEEAAGRLFVTRIPPDGSRRTGYGDSRSEGRKEDRQPAATWQEWTRRRRRILQVWRVTRGRDTMACG